MSKIGRNQPCPCGSGKKYKFCCGRDDNIIPFPGTDGGSSHASGNGRHASHSPAQSSTRATVHPFPGESEPPEDEFVIEEAWDLHRRFDEQMIRRVVEQENHAPLEDFLGLSPAQMFRILNTPFEENAELLEFDPKIESDDVERIPLLDQALYALRSIEELQPLRATKKGNLPRSFVQQLYEGVVQQYLEYDFAYPQKEEDVSAIAKLRHLLTYAGLLKKRKNQFSLTQRASELMATGDLGGIYHRLFSAFSFKYAWGYDDRFPQLAIIQRALIFNLYLLKKLATNVVTDDVLGTAFVRAFPGAMSECADGWGPPDERLSRCFVLRFLNRYAEPFGFVEVGRDEKDPIFGPTEYRVTPVFRRVFRWRV